MRTAKPKREKIVVRIGAGMCLLFREARPRQVGSKRRAAIFANPPWKEDEVCIEGTTKWFRIPHMPPKFWWNFLRCKTMTHDYEGMTARMLSWLGRKWGCRKRLLVYVKLLDDLASAGICAYKLDDHDRLYVFVGTI